MPLFLSNLLTNDSSLWKENHNSTDLLDPPGTLNIYLFCLTCLMTLAALAGSIFSLISLLKMQNRTVVSMLVAFLSVDDFLGVLAVTIFMFLQWPGEVPGNFQSLCTTSALLYLCQGLSSNLKATLLVSYNFYTLRRAVMSQASSRSSGQVLGVALALWAVSLLLSALPLCGWGSFVRTPWGCLADCSSSYVLLLFAVYASAFVLLAGLSLPLILQLLCSEEPPRLHGNYQEISRGASTPGTPPTGGRTLSLSPETAPDRAVRCAAGGSPSSDTVFGAGPRAAAGAGARRSEHRGTLYGTRSYTVSVAQKRFALILALTKVLLWLPMMIHMVVKHVKEFQNLPLETLSFLLTLLAITVTPVFVLSKRWTHLPCGCIINCKQNTLAVASDGEKTKRKGFEFNLSFQQSYGIYKIAREDYYDDDENSISYQNLMNYECETTKDCQRDNRNIFNTIKVEISTTPSLDSSTLRGINKCTNTDITEAKQDSDKDDSVFSDKRESDINYEETTFFEGPERRLSHEENQKPNLSDWEWCRSKSERTPRQRAVVHMDERREEQIVQLLNSVQAKNDKDSETQISWFAPEDHGYGTEISTENKPSSEKKLDNQEKKLINQEKRTFRIRDKSYFDRDSEYLLQSNEPDVTLDQQLLEDLQKKKTDLRYIEMQQFREKLPSYGMQKELVNLIDNHQVTVISGETGCGKTTQVTQFILDNYIERGKGSACRIVCTQPRRISAISVAERVAAERAESCGNGNSTGYQIRLQSRLPRKQGSILYCTTGIILQWLQSDPHLSSVSHIVLDEIHERNLQSDVLMTVIKDLLNFRSDLKVILMSATLNAEKFSEYFGNCPMIHIPGFTFPVAEYLLEDIIEKIRYVPEQKEHRSQFKRGFMQGHVNRQEKEEKEAIYKERWPDYVRELRRRYSASTVDVLEMMDDDKVDLNLIAALIRYIVLEEEDGAILVFLPGWDNISTLHDLLMSQVMFKSDKFLIIPLHSLMPTVNQTQVFKKTPPGVRKIVIATNIAETSITIDDVVYVIDGGKIKETHFDTQNNISTMTAEWVSKANAKQRKGRAGRVQPGHCYHLYNGLRASLLDDYQLPEILRTPLEELCLQIKILRLGGIAYFLSRLMDPPSNEAVLLSIRHLMELNALDKQEELTPLGVHLARLPVEPHIGKMILFGALFCCLDPVLTIAASLSFKDPFVIPLGWEEARRRGFRYEKDYCWEYFLSSNTLQMLHNMKGQFAEHLLGAGFVNSRSPKDPKSNINSDNEKIIKAVICAGLYPKVAKIRVNLGKKRKMVKVYTKTDGLVALHPKSVNVEQTDFHYNWLIYHLKMRTSSIYLYDCTEVSPYCLLFFGGDISIQKDNDQETIAVDEWIVFQSPARIAHLVKELRKELDILLQEKIESPQPVDWKDTKSRDCAVLSAIIDLIKTQEKAAPRNFPPRFQEGYYS
uniref:ATP-dependent DNA/RNA helicase DHX36 n=1 Tax=Oryctolagus cuniculus TaxID=9986 RepID=A0A5F9CVY9_RABIT